MDLTSKVQNSACKPPVVQEKRSKIAFRILLVFLLLYFARPEDFIPGLRFIPVAKITGGLSLLGLIFGMQGPRPTKKLPFEIKILIAMLGWLAFTIPFAWWKGGAFATVVNRFSKAVIVAFLVTLLVERLDELRKLLFVQASCLTLMTTVSIVMYHGRRMKGAVGGVFGNPNELAVHIALNWPLAFAFFLLTKNLGKKMIWAGSMLIMLIGVTLTYSRSGFLSLILSGLVCLYQFGVKGHRIHLLLFAVIASILLAVCAPLVGLSSKTWVRRMQTIVSNDMEGSWDHGSKKQREELLKMSLQLMFSHPFVGIGPGNFASVSGTWHVAHNTYTELGAEAGLPALLMFVMLLIRARGNLKRVTRSKGFKQDMEIQIFTGALWASFVAYLVGAAFSDTQYHLFPYVLVAYTTALYNLARALPAETGPGMKDRSEKAGAESMIDARVAQTECAYYSDYSYRNDSLSRRLVAPN
ncbi:MAG TPA: O-antigen ligase family protein [Nitrososphaera sp.]|nr:O-antigen ligase family protein [Nitrososphaera sp.]